MVGSYTGEYSISYKPVKHGRPGIGATHSSRFIPLKARGEANRARTLALTYVLPTVSTTPRLGEQVLAFGPVGGSCFGPVCCCARSMKCDNSETFTPL